MFLIPIPKDFHSLSLLVICFMMSTRNSNRCDEILVLGLAAAAMGITDGTMNGMGIKPS